MHLNELEKKKILILGFGREGQDSFLFLRRKFPHKVLGVADQKETLSYNFHDREKHTILHLGRDYRKALKKYEVIIKSPGIPKKVIAPYLRKSSSAKATEDKQRVTSQTEIFFENCKGTIIGVTGTKGKSTTASLIHAVLKAGGKRSYLIGNIEIPVLQFLNKATPEDVFVYELSSFQLTNLKRSPHIAVLLNIYPEHLDYYNGSFLAYANAKANITRHQTETDFLIYNAKDPLVARIAKRSKAQKIPFGMPKSRLGTPKRDLGIIASVEPAVLVGKLFGIPDRKIRQAIRNFKPLPHRLERVGKWKGITFYNDSLATIPEAAMSALDSLGPKVHTLIAGGYDRGLTFEKLGKKIRESGIKTLILFPTTGEKILASIRKPARNAPATTSKMLAGASEPPQHFFANSMEEAIRLSYMYTPRDKICLLSPAASSFNMFKDYKDRGEQFKKLAKRYGSR